MSRKLEMTGVNSPDLTDLDGAAWISLEGEFEMGSRRGRDDARPLRKISLSAFRLSTYPVTNAQYAAYLADTGGEAPEGWVEEDAAADKRDHPVTNVSWSEATAFCNWLSEKATGVEGFAHLPSEAQWEFASRGPDGRDYPWGNDEPTPERANYQESGIEDTSAVGSHPQGATPEGVHDLAGNVRQWCRDWYDGYDEADTDDPRGPERGSERVLRGGAFVDAPATLRSAYRFNISPDSRFGFVGFRVAWS